MKKIIFIFMLMLASGSINIFSQLSPGIEVSLITCGPGTATYSIYGHSALRIVFPGKESDRVYNWGVFDFATKNFAWKFAKGRLDYNLGVDPIDRFLESYFFEQRWVQSQKINLEPAEIDFLLQLISENLKPENRKYRYDFFYDDCSTRIRDLLEKTLGSRLIYPPDEKKNVKTFREKVGEYQKPYPWLDLGVDLIMGTPGEKKALLRDRMFLPIDMQKGLSDALINRDSKMIPLLQNPETLVDFETPRIKQRFFASPIFIFSLSLILIIILFAANRRKNVTKAVDIVIFSLFSILALLMIFFNFFTDHQQMKWNLNIIWLSPFIILCLAAIIMNKKWYIWFRTVFFLCLISFFVQIIAAYAFNNSFIPLLLILMLRSSARAGFSWNPLSVDTI
jgi:hypothetical protein